MEILIFLRTGYQHIGNNKRVAIHNESLYGNNGGGVNVDTSWYVGCGQLLEYLFSRGIEQRKVSIKDKTLSTYVSDNEKYKPTTVTDSLLTRMTESRVKRNSYHFILRDPFFKPSINK